MAKYNITNHAMERYAERVSRVGYGKQSFRKQAEEWAEANVPKSTSLGKKADGHLHYRIDNMELVVSTDDQLITILDVDPDLDIIDDIVHAVSDGIKRQLERTIRPYRRMQRELLIEMHEREISRLKVFNPETQDIIGGKISEVQSQLTEVEAKLRSIQRLASKYGVDI